MHSSFDFTKLITFIVKHWKLLVVNLILITIIGVYYSFYYTKKTYVSSATFLAPQENSSFSSLLQMSGIGAMPNDQIMPQQIKFIFESKELRAKIISKFDLYKKYKLTNSKNKFELALKRLKKDMTLDVEEMGSLGVSTPLSFTINCYHESPDTSYEIAKQTIHLLDSTISALSITSAKRNRQYVENQLKINNKRLDSIQTAFGEYQIKNKIYDIPAQLQLALNTYGELKTKLLSNAIQIKTLSNNLNNKAPQLVALEKENAILKNELLKLEKTNNPDIYLGFENSVKISPEYGRMLKDIEIQGQLVLLLTQQFEEAKLTESKNMAVLRIIDQPYKPDYKIKPRRLILLITFVASYMSLLLLLIVLVYMYNEFLRDSKLLYEIRNQFDKK